MTASLVKEFPFYSLDNNSFLSEFATYDCESLNRLEMLGIQDYLKGITSSSSLANLDTAYYTVEKFNGKFKIDDTSTSLSIFHINIRSLNCNYRKLISFLAEIEFKFDVLVLTECWSYNIEFYANLFGSTSYDFMYSLPDDSKVGGVAVYINKMLNAKVRNDLNLASSDYRCEHLWLEFIFERRTYILCAIYRHPNQNIEKFYDLLEPSLSKIHKKRISCIVIGDINIDLLKCTTSTATSSYINNIISSGFIPLSVLPTRVTEKSITIIDHIYLFEGNKGNSVLENCSTGTLVSDISDHFPTFIIFKNPHKLNNVSRPMIRIYNKWNNNNFRNMILKTNWQNEVNHLTDVDTAYDKILLGITTAYYDSFPLVKMSKRAYSNKSWMTDDLKRSSRIKNQLYKKWISTNNLQDKTKYLDCKRAFNKLLKKTQSEYYSNIFNSRINSTKYIWNQINEICSFKNKKSSTLISSIIFNNKTISDSTAISNIFNEYFSKMGQSLTDVTTYTDSQQSDMIRYLGKSNCNSIYCDQINDEEIIMAVKMIPSKRSCGPDELPICIFKNHIDILCPILHFLFNMSIEQGVVPNALKMAKVIPVFKKGDREMITNYRPISLLNSINKIFEKIIDKRVRNFLDKYNLIYNYQFGFRKQHSTSLAVLEVIDECYKKLDEGYLAMGIYFDLQKAFDTVNHDILLKKLYHYGIRGKLHKWFTSYLRNRTQYCCINNTVSEVLNINCGVPQGSVLGPLLFIIYVNDIPNSIISQADNLIGTKLQFEKNNDSNNKLRLFADDTNLFVFAKTLDDLYSKSNNCIREMEKWFGCNRLCVNVTKTCYTVFAPRPAMDSVVCN